MAGVVFLPGGRDWSASSSVFYWALDALAACAEDADLVRTLREISDHNLGALDVEDLPAPQRAELTGLLQRLPAIGRTQLPETGAKAGVVAQLVELAVLCGEDDGRA